MPKLIIGRRDFEIRKLKEALTTGERFAVRREFITEVKGTDDDERALDFTISSAAVDRYGDTVSADGWQLDNFKKNPVVLWAHRNGQLPVAKASKVRVEGGKLKARAEFTPLGLEPFNDQVLALLKGGFLSATSVGFMPLKYNFVNDPARPYAMEFVEQELLEFSIVTVPANPEALIEGRSFHVGEDGPELFAPAIAEAGLGVELAKRRLDLLKL